ncbi:MFS transporter [Corynebacterium lubricantis]|uniref:MFS transporter n=1 Tax=Corynebacterium lubricantis TaxID=541095 RepID=UPI003CCC39BC
MAIIFTAMVFDGYDIVIYGAILPSLLSDPSQIGHLSPTVAGSLGSYTMIGIFIGALGAGAIGDRIGRRKMMIVALVWFSLGMALGAMATSIAFFGATRLFTGLALGVITAGGGAVIAEFAPAHRRNFFNAIAYTGVPVGGVVASFFALWFEGAIGWRGLFLIGATPLLFLVPLAFFFLPESPRWLMSVGKIARAEAICKKYDLPTQQFIRVESAEDKPVGVETKKQKVGMAAIFSKKFVVATLLIGFMSFIAIMATYGLNTWLPQIMQINGMSAEASLYSLVALNGGAAIGTLGAAKIADKIGPKPVIIATFTIAAVCLFALPYLTSAAMIYAAIAITGVGVMGTQILIYGLTANHFPTRARQAGMSWAAGFGRLGGILGPLLGGIIISLGLGTSDAFLVFAVTAVLGGICTIVLRTNKHTVVKRSE